MKSEDCFGGPPPQSWLENISACQSPMYLRVGPSARGTYPEHPAPASQSGLDSYVSKEENLVGLG